MTINVNVVNLFKSKAAKTFNKSKVRRDAHADEYCPSVDARFCSGKKILKFGTTTTVVDMDHNLSKAEPLEYVVSRAIPVDYLTLDTGPAEAGPILVAPQSVRGYPRREAEQDSFQGQVGEEQDHQIIQANRSRLCECSLR